jgi:glycosyltransferase involved in cell wall biosynthesis/GT2 family glycosyltransferase
MICPAAPDYLNTPVHPLRPGYSYKQAAGLSLQPAVTVVTPFHNPGPVFAETVQAVLQQSCQNFEWIIVNDGSSDPDSLSMLAELERQEARVRVIHQPSQGPAAARNRAVQSARADYVFQIDSDDLVEPTFVEKCLWALESYPEFSFCNAHSIGFAEQTYLWPRGFEIGPGFLQENQVPPLAVIRKSAHLAAGGYDESIRCGHEDWDYWLNLAAHGYWGYTIPEYLVWYRRRTASSVDETQSDLEKHNKFRDFLHRKYAALLNGQFPGPQPQPHLPYATVSTTQPYQNFIAKPGHITRILMLLPWLVVGGADTVNLDLAEQFTARNYEITICTTLPSDNPWLAEFARFTPDIFNLPNFLRTVDFPRFLLYLIHSRQIDLMIISNSYLGYQLLPFLRAHCPQVAFVDYIHIEEEYWKNGGYPRAGVGYQELLDLNIVSTHHLKEWMVGQGGDPTRIEVCHTNIDPTRWNPANFSSAEIRKELGVTGDMPLILYAGRICEQKRPRLFAEVIRRLAHVEKLNFTCLVVGDGEDLPFLQEFVQEYHLKPYVRFLGIVTLERFQELLVAADIFFLPSKMEGISVALFEAMAMQTVSVGAEVGGQRELVTPECGFLIPRGENELQEYVSVLKRLIESPELRASMGQAGRRRIVEHFTIERMAERMVELLNRAQELSHVSPRLAVGKGLGLECATLAVEYTRLEKLADGLWAEHQIWYHKYEAAQGQLQAIKNSPTWRIGQRLKHSLPRRIADQVLRRLKRE